MGLGGVQGHRPTSASTIRSAGQNTQHEGAQRGILECRINPAGWTEDRSRSTSNATAHRSSQRVNGIKQFCIWTFAPRLGPVGQLLRDPANHSAPCHLQRPHWADPLSLISAPAPAGCDWRWRWSPWIRRFADGGRDGRIARAGSGIRAWFWSANAGEERGCAVPDPARAPEHRVMEPCPYRP